MTRYEAMEEYERDIRPYLQDVAHHAALTARAVRKIRFRPSFVTKAHAEMLTVEKTLMDALEIVRAAQAEYIEKPVEREHAA